MSLVEIISNSTGISGRGGILHVLGNTFGSHLCQCTGVYEEQHRTDITGQVSMGQPACGSFILSYARECNLSCPTVKPVYVI